MLAVLALLDVPLLWPELVHRLPRGDGFAGHIQAIIFLGDAVLQVDVLLGGRVLSRDGGEQLEGGLQPKAPLHFPEVLERIRGLRAEFLPTGQSASCLPGFFVQLGCAPVHPIFSQEGRGLARQPEHVDVQVRCLFDMARVPVGFGGALYLALGEHHLGGLASRGDQPLLGGELARVRGSLGLEVILFCGVGLGAGSRSARLAIAIVLGQLQPCYRLVGPLVRRPLLHGDGALFEARLLVVPGGLAVVLPPLVQRCSLPRLVQPQCHGGSLGWQPGLEVKVPGLLVVAELLLVAGGGHEVACLYQAFQVWVFGAVEVLLPPGQPAEQEQRPEQERNRVKAELKIRVDREAPLGFS